MRSSRGSCSRTAVRSAWPSSRAATQRRQQFLARDGGQWYLRGSDRHAAAPPLSGYSPREPLEAAGVPGPPRGAGGTNSAPARPSTRTAWCVRAEGRTLASTESLRDLARSALLGRGPLTWTLGEAAAFVRSRPGLAAPDVEAAPLLAPVLYLGGRPEPSPSRARPDAGRDPPPPRRQRGPCSSAPQIRSSPPAVGPALPHQSGGEDEATPLAASGSHDDPGAGAAAQWFVDGEIVPGDDARSDDDLRVHLRAHSRRPASTRRTHTGSGGAGSVIDPRLRVRGVDGLRVADTSLPPELPRGRTNWPTVMIADAASFYADRLHVVGTSTKRAPANRPSSTSRTQVLRERVRPAGIKVRACIGHDAEHVGRTSPCVQHAAGPSLARDRESSTVVVPVERLLPVASDSRS